uniref:Vps72/YL1 C-terminal domain-containing protein n=1 Tax=Chlamydomonas leiostraca TaxID=1034604 RepID=A0A7S0X1N8_9CHLO|mmetsp:Transcript_869/g.2323  ORF Transcript_869/g.2323 Transcript_869/m.2323 type:complete len:477 (+) Transcript_869:28-1458(+)
MGGRELPQRSTRGKRMRDAINDEEDQADQEFWNQDFFQEEQADIDYDENHDEHKEDYKGDEVFDSDFDDPEEEDDDDDAADDVDDKPKKKALKAPEPKAHKPKPKPKEEGDEPPKPKRSKEEIAAEKAAWDAQYAVPTLRRSTMARVAEAEEVRALREQVKPRRAKATRGAEWRPMSQAELLAEAARTEVENMTSLKVMLAMEEEIKKRAVIIKHKYLGPIVKFRSTRRPLPGQALHQDAQQAAADGAAAGEAAAAGAGQKDGAAAEPSKGQQAPGDKAAGAGKDGDTEMADADKAGSKGGSPSKDAAAGDKAAGEGEGGDKAAAPAGAEGGKPEEGKKKKVDDLDYEALAFFEMVNMHYPPMWLRSYRKLPPPAPAMCPVTHQPAMYRDPKTGTPFASAAAYRKLHGLPPAPPPAVPAQAATAAVPDVLPSPSPYFPMVPPQALPLDMQALLVSCCKSLHQGGGTARTVGAAWAG